MERKEQLTAIAIICVCVPSQSPATKFSFNVGGIYGVRRYSNVCLYVQFGTSGTVSISR